ncbi:TetR family transcriptional regulator [Mycobacterium sp. ACS1612]|uniref:ScbR family autoregulator-binding transcription factor n=1 Tax=Mycobacterium sp. ACS1612 TaxID=1834117 RepID=UPI000802173F|nr:ScbR family autoregulator-binding transcription factor [Mycobacterium sp. ACS1612]OBF29894.1 TetR family transcriptional regulator [Mycobacterium sp. ACS1612]
MVRQARSEATRRRIIASAVEVFNEIGYQAAGLGDIIERAEMTKGALYYHFESKESLATAIITEANVRLAEAFRSIATSSAPALENIIHGVFVLADLMAAEQIARSGTQLLRAFGEFNEIASRTYNGWTAEMTRYTRQAIDEGDVREDVDPQAVGETIVGALLGAELLASAITAGADVLVRVTRAWEVLLPGIVTTDSLPYFKQFLAREVMRRSPTPVAD